jgi:hypothetical protein
MAWTIDHDSTNGIICIIYYDTISKQDVEEATEEAFTLAESHGYHLFLTELKNTVPAISISEIFDIPDQWDDLGFKRRNKSAVIVSKDDLMYSEIEFHVVTSRSRGWMVSMFEDKGYAIEWLIST